MKSKEEIIALALTTGLIIPAVASCDEGHEEEKGQPISYLPFEH
ncbi:hypothetical protein [Bacillus pseudomycoides]|nr:hypothetical protein [Bacillus pseudomycoides]